MDLEKIEISEVGNTNPQKSKKKQELQYKNWCFTYNNYHIDDIEKIETIFKKIGLYTFQEETGLNNTPHLQGCITLNKKCRITELKKINPKIHWEKTNNLEASIKYCSKDDTRTGKIYTNRYIPKPIKLINPDRPYQQFILNIFKTEPDDRSIYWFYESNGNVGKSALCKYIYCNYNALFLDEGSKKDIMNTIITYNKDFDIVIIDVPRCNDKVSYKSIESIKNGMCYSGKYEGGIKIFNPPHVIVFSNSCPDIDKLSIDRWNIYEIQSNYDVKKINVLEN